MNVAALTMPHYNYDGTSGGGPEPDRDGEHHDELELTGSTFRLTVDTAGNLSGRELVEKS